MTGELPQVPAVLVQNAQNQIVAVKLGDTVVPVLAAGIMAGAGCTNLTLTIANVSLNYERAAD